MKSLKFLLLLLFLGTGNILQAQELSEIRKRFESLENKQSDLVVTAYEKKDYATSEKSCLTVLEQYATLPTSLQTHYRWVAQNYSYMAACIQSLQGKKAEAIDHLQQAYEAGFQEYAHILKDTDLDNLREEPRFQALLAKIKEVGDYPYILKQAPTYVPNTRTDTLPAFTYPNADTPYLQKVRQYFRLDSVAGKGDELSKIKYVLTYIHNTIKHDGAHENPAGGDVTQWAEACKDGSRGLNCGGLAHVLTQCYLALGIPTRTIACMPKLYVGECHSINAVYSRTLGRWIWIDPTNNAWVMDEQGNLLGQREVRERLRDNLPLILNKEANWNNQKSITKEYYLDEYMAKNLYCFIYTSGDKTILLAPPGFTDSKAYPGRMDYIVQDDDWFWQSPYPEH